MGNKVAVIRAKNIAARDRKEQRLRERALLKQKRELARSERMNSFADTYAVKRAAIIDRRIVRIKSKYEARVDSVGNSPRLKILKFRLRSLENNRQRAEPLVGTLKSTIETLSISEKTSAMCLRRAKHQLRTAERSIQKAALHAPKLKEKIDSLAAKEMLKVEHREAKAREEVEKNLVIKYAQLRLKYLAFIYKGKHERLAKKIAVASVAPAVGEEREKRIQVDEATSYVRWDKKIAEIRDRAQVGKTATKRAKLNILSDKQVDALARRKEMPPAFTLYSGVRDILEIGKSNYVAGFEIRGILNRISAHLRRFSMYYIFAGIVLIFGIATSWTNLNPDNIANIIQSNFYILAIGMAMLLVIVAGAIDLSVGSLLGFCGAMSVYTYNQYNGNLAASLITTLLIGLGYGLLQGFLIGYFKMPSFIVTLGGMLLFAGLTLFLTKGQAFAPIGSFDADYVQWVVGTIETPLKNEGDIHLGSFFIIFGCGLLVAIAMFFGRSKRVKYGIETGGSSGFLIKIFFALGLFTALAYFIGASGAGLRYYMLYILALAVIFMFITQNTTFGRAVYAVGGNKRAAFLSGINVARTQMLVFGLIGLVTSFAAVLYAGINVSATAQSGVGFELNVISSVFVGGASMTGGIGTIPGTLIGGMALGFINNGLYLLSLGVDIQGIVRGCILIGAVGYDVYTHRKIG